MLRSIKQLHGGAVRAKDGDIGYFNQAYFDLANWCIRYFVVKTGDGPHKRPVLISPYSIKHSDSRSSTLHVGLTRQQVRNGPHLDTRRPVFPRHEFEYLHDYDHPAYWDGPNPCGAGAYPDFDPAGPSQIPEADHPLPARTAQAGALTDTHLRSTGEIKGYRIASATGRIGHVSDFIYDDETWMIRYLAIDTRNGWLTHKTVLIAIGWLGKVDWTTATISTTLTRDAIRKSPEYDGSQAVYRSDEVALHQFHDKQGYWSHAEPSMARDRL